MKDEEVISTLEFLKIAAQIDAKPVNVNTEALDVAIKAVQQPKIIYCKDCKYQVKRFCTDKRFTEGGYWEQGCSHFGEIIGYWGWGGDDDQFCSDAEPKETPDES